VFMSLSSVIGILTRQSRQLAVLSAPDLGLKYARYRFALFRYTQDFLDLSRHDDKRWHRCNEDIDEQAGAIFLSRDRSIDSHRTTPPCAQTRNDRKSSNLPQTSVQHTRWYSLVSPGFVTHATGVRITRCRTESTGGAPDCNVGCRSRW